MQMLCNCTFSVVLLLAGGFAFIGDFGVTVQLCGNATVLHCGSVYSVKELQHCFFVFPPQPAIAGGNPRQFWRITWDRSVLPAMND